jgi:hypothetical protein
MKRSLVAIALCLGCFGCRAGDRIEKRIEGGVEVVLNHAEPYRLPGRPAKLSLQEELTVDFGRDDIGALGVANAIDFEVDGTGRIFFFDSNAKENTIFVFDQQGRFLRSFGRKGQGPGEIQWILFTRFDAAGNLIISDHQNRKVLTFDASGRLLGEQRFPAAPGRPIVLPLDGGNYLCLRQNRSEKSPAPEDIFSLLDGEFREIAVLDRRTTYDPDTLGFRGVVSQPVFRFVLSAGHIFTVNEARGYEILKYDQAGKLVQKIRKEAVPVEIAEDVKRERTKRFEGMGGKVWFPEHWPPISTFFADDQGMIYVRTFEPGDRPGESRFDVFDADGIFFSRISLRILAVGDREAAVRFKNAKLYAMQEKPDGFREFKIYRMLWTE